MVSKNIRSLVLDIGKKDNIAYPTIVLFGINTFLLICLFCIRSSIPYAIYLFFSSILFYINFTPFHESAHGLLASKEYHYINGCIGRISSIIYGTSYAGWIFLHHLHHMHTNHDIDPDNFYNSLGEVMIKGPFLDVIYLYNYMKHIHIRPTVEVIEALSTYACIFYVYGYFMLNHMGMALFYYYILPVRFSLLCASVVLDYNAHHKCPQKKDNNIKSTNKVSGFFKKDDSPLLLSMFTQNQNYHNIHHLYPFIPFYKYQDVWNNQDIRKHLMDEGTNEINMAEPIEQDVHEMKEMIEDIIEDKKQSLSKNCAEISKWTRMPTMNEEVTL